MAENVAVRGIGGSSTGRAWRLGSALVRRLDILPPGQVVGPVTYRAPLVVFVVVTAMFATAIAALNVRFPQDGLTLGVGGAIIFLMSVYGVRSLPPVRTVWSPSYVHLGLSVTLGPAGALAAAAAEALGVAIRGRSGWFRTTFNTSNHFLANMTAWAVFATLRAGLGASPLASVLAGLCAGVGQYAANHLMLSLVVRLADPSLKLPTVIRHEAAFLPYSIGYGLAAFAFVVMHQQAGVVGFTALLVPMLLLQGFLIVFARRVYAYEEQRAAFQKEREELLQKAVEASEAERRRIARDLHDGVVQNLAGMAFALSATASELKGKKAEGEPPLLELLEQSADQTRSAMKDLRTLIVELAPPTLRREGLHAALLEVMRTLKRKGTHTRLDLPSNLRLREDRAALIFRVAQEILRNVEAHAAAKNVTVQLTEEGSMAVLRIEDDGKGFTPQQVARRRAQGHLGTSAMAELAEEADGTLEIDTAPGKGTRVTLRVPVH